MKHEIPLNGCAQAPLAHYLKAAGVLRYCAGVEVLEPAELRRAVGEALREALVFYLQRDGEKHEESQDLRMG